MKAILFVDDHEVLARLSCEILEMQGFRAVSAYSAQDALEKFKRERFDLMVTDFRMEGMNGLELAKRIHSTNPEVPVIIVTGYGPIDVGGDAQACLPKEAMFPALIEKIKTYLGDSEHSLPSLRSA
jgi:DNA-binding NtrC family response regulator